ncbi:hypothetical protein QPK87_06990 [Kamptonema cortianum]|nr:hypothetical protein [Kamptonema cortianum]
MPDLTGTTTGSIVTPGPITARFTNLVVLDKREDTAGKRSPTRTNDLTIMLPAGESAETVSLSFIGLPAGVTGTFASNPVNLVPGSGGVSAVTLSVVPGSANPPVGDYPVRIRIDRNVGVDLEVPFTLTILDGDECAEISVEHDTLVTLIYYSGGQASSEAYLLLNSSGSNEVVNFSIEGLPSYVNYSIDPVSLLLLPGVGSDGVHVSYWLNYEDGAGRKGRDGHNYEDFPCFFVVERGECENVRVPFTLRIDYYGE